VNRSRLTAGFLLFFSIPLRAELALTAAQAVERALQNNQLLAASSERVASLEGLRLQAQARPNPRFFFQSENLRAWQTPSFSFGDNSDTFLYFSQVLESPGKRARRIELADAGISRGQLERELLGYQIASRVRHDYWAAAGANAAATLLAETLRSYEQTITYHEARVREGAMAEVDLIRVRLEGERLRIAQNAAVLEADRARIRLLQDMGEREFPPVRFDDALTPSISIPAIDIDRAIENRPDVRVLREAVAQARAQARRQQTLAKPDYELLGGYKRSAGFDTLITGLQFNIPLTDRNKGNIAAAEAEIRVAERTRDAQEAVVRAEIRAAQADYEIRLQQLNQTLAPMRQQAQEAARIASAAYREGGTDLLRLIDAERLKLETDLLYVRTLSEFRQSVVALEAALGVKP
jgi:outer membrane protein TolC